MGTTRDLLSNYQHIIDDVRLITGDTGIFEVVVDGKTIYSKADKGRHADDGEVLELFADLYGADVQRYGT